MTRRPVIRYKTAGHPLRRSVSPPKMLLLSREPLSDFKLFLLTFASGFLAFYGFLS